MHRGQRHRHADGPQGQLSLLDALCGLPGVGRRSVDPLYSVLSITREYFAIQHDRIEPLSDTRRTEIDDLMRRSFDNQVYILQTDLERVFSIGTVAQIFLQDRSLNTSTREKEDSTMDVQKRAPKLFALWV